MSTEQSIGLARGRPLVEEGEAGMMSILWNTYARGHAGESVSQWPVVCIERGVNVQTAIQYHERMQAACRRTAGRRCSSDG